MICGMRITDVTATYEVEFPTRVITDRYGTSYEVSRVTVQVSDQPGGEVWTDCTTKGYKLTKAGKRSQSAPHALSIWGDEVYALEAEALAYVLERTAVATD